MPARIRVLHTRSQATGAAEAVAAVAAALHPDAAQFAALFCSSKYDRDELGAAIRQHFKCPTLACTTSGELSSAGFTDSGIVATAIHSTEMRASVAVADCRELDDAGTRALVATLSSQRRWPSAGAFAIMLIDGMSNQEERITAAAQAALGSATLVGGSAGDDLAFRESWVYDPARGFVRHAVAFALIETTLPFRVFRTDHFRPTGRRFAVTAARPSERRVLEIDGAPAVEGYADVLGIPVHALGLDVFAANPALIRIGDQHYVRGIQRADPDGSLVFYGSIDEGLVLRVGESVPMAAHLESCLADLDSDVGGIQLAIGFDCILRRMESKHRGLDPEIARILSAYPFVGFSTYGEQFGSIHINQTLTGVAIGGGR